jgi:hypothetical protein
MTKKIKQIKLPVELADLADLIVQEPPQWKLVRERDGLTKHSTGVTWIEFGDNGFYKDRHDEPAVGRSLLMSPFSQFFTWQTTVVTEIVEQTPDYIKFHTGNSTYELFKI